MPYADGWTKPLRGAIPRIVAAAAACSAQGFQAGTQLWLFATQQQAADCVAEPGAQACPEYRAGLGEATSNFALPVLWPGDANRAKALAPTGAQSSAWRDLGRGCDAVAGAPITSLKLAVFGWGGRARSKTARAQ